jgi:hypothetical protein
VSFGRAVGEATPAEVAAACDDARPIGDGSCFIARCPNPKHLDRHRSFSIGPGHSQPTVVNCLARCDPVAVLAALRARGVVVGRPRGDSYPGSRPALARPVGKLALVADDPWRIVLPVPDDAPVFPSMQRVQHWVYRDAEGRLLGATQRKDRDDGGKYILPWTYWRNVKNGRAEWRCKAFPSPKPVYRLDRLAGFPDLPVVIVEGEKCCDAGNRVCPQFVWVSWPGGAAAAHLADWGPLVGRRVTLWPDSDQVGIEAAQSIARRIKSIAATVRILRPPAGVPKGWDIANAIEDNSWSEQAIAKFIVR